jgi:hypothetical protein
MQEAAKLRRAGAHMLKSASSSAADTYTHLQPHLTLLHASAADMAASAGKAVMQ